jgi:ribosomal protein L40E
MVTNEEIKRRLEAKRKGKKPPSDKKEINLQGETCPNCKTLNPPEAKFCVGCGEALNGERPTSLPSKTVETESLETKTTASNGPLSSMQVEYKICPSCKQKNKVEAKFCVICGNKFDLETGPEKSTRIEDIDRKIPEIRAPGHLQSQEAEETIDQETEETTPKNIPQISFDREESDTPPKSELTSAPSSTNYEDAETVAQSVPTGKIGKSSVLSENVDPVEKIRKAKELLDIGAITQEEFEQIKNKYLEQI